MTGWHLNAMTPFDIESGGVQVESDGVVSITVGTVGGSQPTDMWAGLIAVDFDVDPGAVAIHGITTEYAREHGKAAVDVLDEAAGRLADSLSAGRPVVGMNLVFDFTILDRNCRRYGVRTVSERLNGPIAPVVDVLCIDKHLDRYRPGKRKLEDLCQTYGVRLDNAHDAVEDALAAARVAYAIGARSQKSPDELCAIYGDRRFPRRMAQDWEAFGGLTLEQIHAGQVGWYRDQSASLGDYWAKKAEECTTYAGFEEPPALDGLPDADAEERRGAWRDQAEDYRQRIASLRYDWPLVLLEGAA